MNNKGFKSETLNATIRVAEKSAIQQHLEIVLNTAKTKIGRANLMHFGKELIELRDMVAGIIEELDELMDYADGKGWNE